MPGSDFYEDSSTRLGLGHGATIKSGGIQRFKAKQDAEHEAALKELGAKGASDYLSGRATPLNAGASDLMGELLNEGFTVEQAHQYLREHPEEEATGEEGPKDSYLGASVESLMDRQTDGRHGRSRGRSRGGKRGTKPTCRDCHMQYCNCPTRGQDRRLRESEPRSVFTAGRVTKATSQTLKEKGIKTGDALTMLARAIETGDFAALGNAIQNGTSFESEKQVLKDSA